MYYVLEEESGYGYGSMARGHSYEGAILSLPVDFVVLAQAAQNCGGSGYAAVWLISATDYKGVDCKSLHNMALAVFTHLPPSLQKGIYPLAVAPKTRRRQRPLAP